MRARAVERDENEVTKCEAIVSNADNRSVFSFSALLFPWILGVKV